MVLNQNLTTNKDDLYSTLINTEGAVKILRNKYKFILNDKANVLSTYRIQSEYSLLKKMQKH